MLDKAFKVIKIQEKYSCIHIKFDHAEINIIARVKYKSFFIDDYIMGTYFERLKGEIFCSDGK